MTKTRTHLTGTLVGVAVLALGYVIYDANNPRSPDRRRGDEPVTVRWEATTNAPADTLVSSYSTIRGSRKHLDTVLDNESRGSIIPLINGEMLTLTVTVELVPPIDDADKRIMCDIYINDVHTEYERRVTRGGSPSSVVCQAEVR